MYKRWKWGPSSCEVFLLPTHKTTVRRAETRTRHRSERGTVSAVLLEDCDWQSKGHKSEYLSGGSPRVTSDDKRRTNVSLSISSVTIEDTRDRSNIQFLYDSVVLLKDADKTISIRACQLVPAHHGVLDLRTSAFPLYSFHLKHLYVICCHALSKCDLTTSLAQPTPRHLICQHVYGISRRAYGAHIASLCCFV